MSDFVVLLIVLNQCLHGQIIEYSVCYLYIATRGLVLEELRRISEVVPQRCLINVKIECLIRNPNQSSALNTAGSLRLFVLMM